MRQGMNEIAAVLLVLCEHEKMSLDSKSEAPSGGEEERSNSDLLPDLLDAAHVEADVFCLFSLVMDRMASTFLPTRGNREHQAPRCPNGAFASSKERPHRCSTLERNLHRIQNTLLKVNVIPNKPHLASSTLRLTPGNGVSLPHTTTRAVFCSLGDGDSPRLFPLRCWQSADPELAAHLCALDLEPHMYLLRWLRLLFAREFCIDKLFLLWDAIFALTPDDFEFCDYIALAMLWNSRENILKAVRARY